MTDRPATASHELHNICPVCGGEMEDSRHVAVECFYDVSEVVADAQKSTIFVEVGADAPIWGTTRNYGAGTRDRFVVSEGRDTVPPSGPMSVIHVERVPEPIPPIRLAELNSYSVTCCKNCRADFLRIFGRWARGDLAVRDHPSPEAVVPVRDLGAIRYVTKEEAEERRNEKMGEPTRAGTRDDPDAKQP